MFKIRLISSFFLNLLKLHWTRPRLTFLQILYRYVQVGRMSQTSKTVLESKWSSNIGKNCYRWMSFVFIKSDLHSYFLTRWLKYQNIFTVFYFFQNNLYSNTVLHIGPGTSFSIRGELQVNLIFKQIYFPKLQYYLCSFLSCLNRQ